jgi:hypothetical protein
MRQASMKELSQARETERGRAVAELRKRRGLLLKKFIDGLRALQPLNRQLFELDEAERELCAGVADSFGWMELVEGGCTQDTRLQVYLAACRQEGYDI